MKQTKQPHSSNDYRYCQTEKYTWHLDALVPQDDLYEKGGQRTATLLLYLTDMGDDAGGATMSCDLGGGSNFLKVQPKKTRYKGIILERINIILFY